MDVATVQLLPGVQPELVPLMVTVRPPQLLISIPVMTSVAEATVNLKQVATAGTPVYSVEVEGNVPRSVYVAQ